MMPYAEPHIARICSWAALIGAFLLSWTTWVGIGDIAEYGAFAYALPVCVDGYIVTVLMAWIAPRDSKAAKFARWNVYLSAGLSILTQSIYHGALVYSDTTTPWKALIAWLAGALPPLFAALSVHFRTGVKATEAIPASTPATPAAVPQSPAPPAVPVATPSPYPVVSRETPSIAPQPVRPAVGTPPWQSAQRSAPQPPAPTVAPPVAPAPPAWPMTLPRERRVMPTATSRATETRRKAGRTNREEEARRKAAAVALLEGLGTQQLSDAEIARRSGASPKTIKRYRQEVEAQQAAEGKAS